MNICESEKRMPTPVAISIVLRETPALNQRKSPLATTEIVLTILQNSTFERRMVEGFIGNILALSAAFPSRDIFVAQKVLVRIPNTSITISVSASSKDIPIALMRSVSKSV